MSLKNKRDVSFDTNAGESAGTLGQADKGEDGIPEGVAAGTGGVLGGPTDGVNEVATQTAAGVDLKPVGEKADFSDGPPREKQQRPG